MAETLICRGSKELQDSDTHLEYRPRQKPDRQRRFPLPTAAPAATLIRSPLGYLVLQELTQRRVVSEKR